jgi:hypothetical protein
MKAHIKKGMRKKNEQAVENYRHRFRKLYSMINIWKHYVVSYFRIQEDRYYDKLYKKRNRRAKNKLAQEHAGTMQVKSQLQMDSTLNLDIKESEEDIVSQPEDKDSLSKLNIHFFIEEMFFYAMEIMHATAAMAYTYW